MESKLIEVPAQYIPPRHLIFIDQHEWDLAIVEEKGDAVFGDHKPQVEAKGEI